MQWQANSRRIHFRYIATTLSSEITLVEMKKTPHARSESIRLTLPRMRRCGVYVPARYSSAATTPDSIIIWYINMPSSKEISQAHKVLFDEGITIRREVAGDKYVDAALSRFSSDFSKPLQELTTEVGWGWAWSRPGLDRKQRSLLNLGMLCALNRSTELGVHVRGSLRNGLSEVEIREALLQVGCYCGLVSGWLSG